MWRAVGIFAFAGLLLADVCANGETFPYTVTVRTERAQVRCGPGDDFYRTSTLANGQTAEVWRHDPAGWLAIRPPVESHSLVAARHVRALSSSGMAEVVDDEAVAWVGAEDAEISALLWQVRLK